MQGVITWDFAAAVTQVELNPIISCGWCAKNVNQRFAAADTQGVITRLFMQLIHKEPSNPSKNGEYHKQSKSEPNNKQHQIK